MTKAAIYCHHIDFLHFTNKCLVVNNLSKYMYKAKYIEGVCKNATKKKLHIEYKNHRQ